MTNIPGARYCLLCGKFITQKTINYVGGPFCCNEHMERHLNKIETLHDIKWEYYKDTHPRLLGYYYGTRKVGGPGSAQDFYPD